MCIDLVHVILNVNTQAKIAVHGSMQHQNSQKKSENNSIL